VLVEEPLALAGRNALAEVADAPFDLGRQPRLLVRRDPDVDGRARRRVLERVVDQVDQGEAQMTGVGPGQRVQRRRGEAQALPFLGVLAEDFLGQRDQIDRRQRQRGGARVVDAGRVAVEQYVDQLRHALHGTADLVVALDALWRGVGVDDAQRFAGGGDDGDRRADLVGDHR